MSVQIFVRAHRLYLCVAVFLLAAIVTVWVLVARADDLSVATVPSMAAESSLLPSANETHVIVVGAGAAGLSAAYTLENAGYSYTLLEASSTFGGRVRETKDLIDLPLDLGAEWLHVMPRILQDLLLVEEDRETSKEIEIIEYQPQTISFFRRGKRRNRNWLRHFYVEYKFKNTTWWSYFDNYFFPYVAESSVFEAIVNRIEYLEGEQPGVVVSTVDGRRFVGSHVVVAVPAAILQDRDIEFSPQLSEHVWRTIDEVVVADGLKVWLEFDERFYPDMQSTKSLLRGLEVPPLFFDAVFRKPTDRHVVCLFAVNQAEASALVLKPDKDIVDDSISLLEQIFSRSDLRDHLIQSRVQNWSQEPHIRGAYTWNEGEYDQSFLRRPLYNGRMFLAGEYLAGYHTATVHGAAINGRGAALKILSQQL